MALQPSLRVQETTPAIIDRILEEYETDSRVMFNLCPGSFFLGMAKTSLLAAAEALKNEEHMNNLSSYGDVRGFHPLRKRWLSKILLEWDQKALAINAAEIGAFGPDFGLELMVTAGSNQGFINSLVCVADPGDEVILAKPYYWGHFNAIKCVGCNPVLVQTDISTFLPSIESLREAITDRTKALVIVNPANPTGIVIPRQLMDQIVQLCEQQQVWLIIDEAYKEFIFEPESNPHYSPPIVQNVIKLYTMSKVYGLAGWRVASMVYPATLSESMRKIQDTIPTHSTKLSDIVAYSALNRFVRAPGSLDCVSQRVAVAKEIRSIFMNALWPPAAPYKNNPLSKYLVEPQGAFYIFLPVDGPGVSKRKEDVIEFLVEHEGVLVTPGSAFGMPDYIRVAYGRVEVEWAEEAASALATGLTKYFEAIL